MSTHSLAAGVVAVAVTAIVAGLNFAASARAAGEHQLDMGVHLLVGVVVAVAGAAVTAALLH